MTKKIKSVQKAPVKAAKPELKLTKKEDAVTTTTTTTKNESLDNKLSQEELLAIEKIVSPMPEKGKDGKLVKGKDEKIKLQLPSQEEVQLFNDVLQNKQVDVGIVIQLAAMFVNNLQSFTVANLQGLMDTIEIQKRVINRVATEDGLDIDDIISHETKAFTAELAEKMAQEK